VNIEIIREYCLSKPGASEGLPFGEQTLVFYVGPKMFALIPLDEIQLRINLKCDPERSFELRQAHESIYPGFHMNKKHWNTVLPDGLNADLVYELIDHSYDLVLKGMPGKLRTELGF
jgi:predicted DNA-binding protein (MmcQ/YjbR family)